MDRVPRAPSGTAPPKSSDILDPLERSSEIIFGLIMALTFTCTISVVSSTRNDVSIMLASALACNVAWGLVDGAMFVLASVVTRERKRSFAVALKGASQAEARQIVVEHLPEAAGRLLTADELDRLAGGVRGLPPAAATLAPTREDLRAAAGVFILVFLSTLPVAVPFMIFGEVGQALRISNAIAVTLLFLVGMRLGHYMGWRQPWVIGVAVAGFGAVLVAVTIALGG